MKLALANPSGGGSPITIRAKKTGTGFVGNKIADKVYDDMKTLYDLGEPDTHAFKVEQTYSDSRKGEKARLDVMSYVPLQDLKVIDLDTAKPLETLKEGSGTVAKLEVPIADDKQSAHLRVSGRAQDPAFLVENGDLVFERTLRGLRNTVLLPAGWDVSGRVPTGDRRHIFWPRLRRADQHSSGRCRESPDPREKKSAGIDAAIGL